MARVQPQGTASHCHSGGRRDGSAGPWLLLAKHPWMLEQKGLTPLAFAAVTVRQRAGVCVPLQNAKASTRRPLPTGDVPPAVPITPRRSRGIVAGGLSTREPAQCHGTAGLGTPQDLPVPLTRGRWLRGAGAWPPPHFSPPTCPEPGPEPRAVPPTSNVPPAPAGRREVHGGCGGRGGPAAAAAAAIPAGCSSHSSAGGSCATTPARPPQHH